MLSALSNAAAPRQYEPGPFHFLSQIRIEQSCNLWPKEEAMRTSWRTACMALAMAASGATIAQTSGTLNELSAAPGGSRSTRTSIASAGVGWYSCLVTAQCKDKVVGSGAIASNSDLEARVRITNWQYATGVEDFKGPRLATHFEGNDLAYRMPRYTGGSTTADSIVGMRVGGLRVIAVPRQQFVFEIELLELAPVRISPRGNVLTNYLQALSFGNNSPPALQEEERHRRDRGEKYVGDIRHAVEIEQALRYSRICRASEPSTARTSIFGLVVGAPLPCLNACSDERQGEPRTFVCLRYSKTTPWGTQMTGFEQADGFFESARYLGRTSLEVLNGNLVGVRVEGISLNAQTQVIDLLSSKFGAASVKGSTYQWNTPSVNVRYVTDDDIRTPISVRGQVDFLHPLGEGLEVGDPIARGTITIYSPETRTRVEEFEQAKADQEKKKRKLAF